MDTICDAEHVKTLRANVMLDVIAFGIDYLSDFERVAVVTVVDWIIWGVSLFSRGSTPMCGFVNNQTEAAMTWPQKRLKKGTKT